MAGKAPSPKTIRETAAEIRRGETSCSQLVTAAIERAEALDSKLGVYLHLDPDGALRAAIRADRELASGIDRGPLHGIPIGIKDVLDVAGMPTSAQSLLLSGAKSPQRDSSAVRKLRAAGVIVLGKTTTMEFAIGLPDPQMPFPVPRNPWDVRFWAGGSSSGSASGVAAGLFLAAIGTDTGGSIRIPAAYCGVTGFKPTFGTVNRSGVYPLSQSMDHVGPIARTADDCRLLFEAMRRSRTVAPPDPLSKTKAMRLGVVRHGVTNVPGVLPIALECLNDAVEVMKALGMQTLEVPLEHHADWSIGALVTWMSEAMAHHRRSLQTRWDDYGIHTSAILGTAALFTASDYVQAQRVRIAARQELQRLFRTFDALVTLTAGTEANPLEGLNVPTALASPVFTRVWNYLGCPALSLPMGFGPNGLPLGLQVIGPPGSDTRILDIGTTYQSATTWHTLAPSTS